MDIPIWELAPKAWGLICAHKETAALILSLIFTLWGAIKSRMSSNEAVLLLINVLKDEQRMTPEGRFKGDLIDKIDQVAKVAAVGQTAATQVKDAIGNINSGGLKVGSYRGKPIFLEDVTRVAVVLKSALDVFRGIFRR